MKRAGFFPPASLAPSRERKDRTGGREGGREGGRQAPRYDIAARKGGSMLENIKIENPQRAAR